MTKLLVWLVVLFFCWPIALLAIILYPIIWLLSIPFRLMGIAVEGVFAIIRTVITLPARILDGSRN